MRRTLGTALLALVACTAWAPSARAGWLVRAPFVDVHVGGPAPLAPPPAATPPVPPPAVVRVPTLEEFAATFRPAPGSYEVTILHSRSGCPVTVCFTLPPGCPKVCVHRHQIDFEYPCEDVRIRCQIGGKVKVSYH